MASEVSPSVFDMLPLTARPWKDSLTSSTSTSPYDTAHLKEMLNLVNYMCGKLSATPVPCALLLTCAY
jgi:hypothetical protein